MRNSSVRPFFTQESYRHVYLHDPHFLALKNKLIYSNSSAKCWICERTNTLLLHHLSYVKLYREKKVFTVGPLVIGDVVVLCFDCHTKVHFIKILWIFRYRIPRKRFWLVKRMKWLRSYYLFKERRLIRFYLSILSYLL